MTSFGGRDGQSCSRSRARGGCRGVGARGLLILWHEQLGHNDDPTVDCDSEGITICRGPHYADTLANRPYDRTGSAADDARSSHDRTGSPADDARSSHELPAGTRYQRPSASSGQRRRILLHQDQLG